MTQGQFLMTMYNCNALIIFITVPFILPFVLTTENTSHQTMLKKAHWKRLDWQFIEWGILCPYYTLGLVLLVALSFSLSPRNSNKRVRKHRFNSHKKSSYSTGCRMHYRVSLMARPRVPVGCDQCDGPGWLCWLSASLTSHYRGSCHGASTRSRVPGHTEPEPELPQIDTG